MSTLAVPNTFYRANGPIVVSHSALPGHVWVQHQVLRHLGFGRLAIALYEHAPTLVEGPTGKHGPINAERCVRQTAMYDPQPWHHLFNRDRLFIVRTGSPPFQHVGEVERHHAWALHSGGGQQGHGQAG